ncbi:MAG TPA: peptidase inhibitor family I36 protein [Pseudonocardiaceae bacterium]|nr:peptidase inhibitor family I36 protein [Pseudonocardiaceae bacterium]
MATPDVASNCPSGDFCFWTQTGFNGTRYQFSGNGFHDLRGIAGPFRSLYNHRSKSAFVHKSNQGTPEFCVEPQEKISNMNLSYNHAAWLYLNANQTTC